MENCTNNYWLAMDGIFEKFVFEYTLTPDECTNMGALIYTADDSNVIVCYN